MSTFILIHGGWHGAWCWRKVIPLLQDAGYRVIAPDLPGHGNDIAALYTHPYERYVPAVVSLIDEQPEEVILVGHSSGGAIITTAAEQRPPHIHALVYLAAFLIPPGSSVPMLAQNDTESLLRKYMIVNRDEGTSSFTPEGAKIVFYNDCTDEDVAWATSLLTPEPLIPRNAAPATAPQTGIGHIPKFYIETLRDKALGPATQKWMYTAAACQKVYSLSTGHSPFLSAPEQLVDCLLDIA